MHAFISKMPRPCSAAGSDVRPYPISFRSRILFPDPSRQWTLHCRARSGNGCVLLFLDLPDCRARLNCPGLLGAPARRRVLPLEHIAIFQSAASSGPIAVRSLESCWASRSQFPGWKNGNAFLKTLVGNSMFRSGFAFHSWQTPRAKEKCNARAKARRVPRVAEPIDLYGYGEPKDRF